MKPTVNSISAGRGMTIVELLISVTIGLLITIVIAQLFLNTRQTFATTDDMSRMQENIRFAQALLTRTIHLAGYKSQPNSVTATVFSGSPVLATTAGGNATASDRLTVRYQGSGSQTSALTCKSATPPLCTGADLTVLDCLGVAVDAGMMAESTFSIQNGLNNRPALFCNNGVNDVEIVPDVENMQVLFGEDTNADLTADHYTAVPTNPANPADPTGRVVSVRVALMFTTPNDFVKGAVDNRTYEMFSDGVSVLGPYPDRRVRRVVVTTVNLRNRTP